MTSPGAVALSLYPLLADRAHRGAEGGASAPRLTGRRQRARVGAEWAARGEGTRLARTQVEWEAPDLGPPGAA